MKDFDFQIGIIKNKNSDSLDIDIFYQTDKWDFTKKSINISNNEVKKNKNLYLIDISNLINVDTETLIEFVNELDKFGLLDRV